MDNNKILIVDDDPNIREVVSVLLGSEGYAVDQAEGGDEALEKVYADRSIDLVILDIMMPGLSGVEVCTRIREKSPVPVLFLTAKSQDQDKVEAYTEGGDDYLVKPFSQTELLMKVKSLIRRYKEYDILQFFMEHKGEIVENKDLYEGVWGEKYLPSAGNTIMVHVLNLRKKLEEDANNPKIIKTVWGKGYKVE